MAVRSPFAPIVVLLVLLFWQPVDAQLKSLEQLGGKAAKEAAAETPEQLRTRIELWQQEARDLIRRSESEGHAASLPEGVTEAELEDRRRTMEQILVVAGNWLKNFDMVADARKAAETARLADAGWAGFEEAPPYSILMLDELLNERDATKTKLSSQQSSYDNFISILSTTKAELKVSEEAENAAKLVVRDAASPAVEAAKWRLESASIGTRLLALRVEFLEASSSAATERVAASKSELALVEKKIRTVAPNSVLSDEDLTKIEKIVEERKAAYNKEIVAFSKRMKSAQAGKTQAQAALDALLESSVDGKEPVGTDLARMRLTVAEARVESLQTVSDTVESLVQLENLAIKAYQSRAVLIRSEDQDERKKALDQLVSLSDRLKAWINVAENDMTTAGAGLSRIESQAAAISADDPRFPLINEQRAATSEVLLSLQRTVKAVEVQRKTIRRWIADHSPKEVDRTWAERMKARWTELPQRLKDLWNFRVMTFEDKFEINGRMESAKVPVTLGMLLRAILFFVIGYWIVSRLVNRIQRVIVHRGLIAEPQARTLRNWAMIVVGVFLMLGTLAFLKIPLTVFAFFGGALAIGVGFGTQTLIKNFISGIIVLAERKIRVGDILDVDGIVGVVTEVNTRSSIIRSADDIETMIPNSMFLENRVINWTLSNSRIRRSIRVGVAYGAEPKQVMEILTEAAGRHGLILKNPEPFAIFEEFADHALLFSVYYWLDLHSGANSAVVASDLRLIIDKRFNEAGIHVPASQRGMHLSTDEPISVRISTDA